MTAAERLVLILTADLLVAFGAELPFRCDDLVKRLKEARHALDAEAFWAANRSTTDAI
jgi:hypothetical protein